ncbi:hypothetical protein BJ138DRAFT_340174 [Hygrophoropsis aurantiaca]|uniref:Uncharacterized protein n=1 Tax=Hygrophoropsis aurantiaca TaxID=72124 RepID=A0ACB8A517_9AGAM|nr:hypothetical protein BJ138DRAFT_340174 [Hygrophoropsis aurantiaca]
MPEYKESLISGHTIRHFMNAQPPESLYLLNLWVDPTAKEMKSAVSGTRESQGLVYALKDDTTIKRGQLNSQKPVYPPGYANMATPISHHRFQLVGVEFSPRNVILNLGKQWLQIQLFTHVCAQVYTRSDWEDAICKVHRKARFKVGVALEFSNYIIAFTTLDNIIATHWATSRQTLPAQHPDVYKEYHRFLATLVEWICQRKSKQRGGFAMAAIRDAPNVFGGVGKYTCCEIFTLAGLPPAITEAELFDSPDRTARFCCAYYDLAADAHQNLWPFVKRFLHGYTIGTTLEQRLKYADQLFIWGKERMEMSSRMHDLLGAFESTLLKYNQKAEELNNHWYRSDVYCLYDPFEPALTPYSLKRVTLNLGHLVFGEKWPLLSSEAGIQVLDTGMDPLSQYFNKTTLSRVWINPNAYSTLFNINLRARWKTTKVYRMNSDSDVWSIIPAFSDRSLSSSKAVSAFNCTEYDTADRQSRIIKTVITTSKVWTVGPLDYCGIGRVVLGQGSRKNV